MTERIIYAGTYTGKESEGIYRFSFNEGKLGEADIFCRINNPKYLCRYKDRIIAVCDFDNGSGTALIDPEGNILDQISFENETSCYVTCKDDYIYTANYHAGTVSKLKITNNRFTLIKNITIRNGAGCHQVLFYKDKILVLCLFLDKIIIFDEDLNQADEIIFPEGSGPRHGIFPVNGDDLYLASELSNELFMIDMETKKISAKTDLLNKTHVKGTAAIRMKDDHLYVSTRGEDVISVVSIIDLELKQIHDCGGEHPRDFIIVDDHLVCANRFSNNVVSFALNKDGSIGEKTGEIYVPEAVSLIL